MIEARNVVKRVQGNPVLNGLSFSFAAGRMYGIIGPNGVGKSTLLQLLSGVDKPDAGEVLLEGKPVSGIPRKTMARQVAVLQQGGLPPAAFTVREAVAMGRFPYQNWLGDEKGDAGPILDRAIGTMGLKPLESRPLDRLSGGERQRAALAKVMAQQAKLIMLDEPTTYLDIGYQAQLLDTVRNWQRTDGLTVLAVLHDLNLAALYCDELLVLHRGTAAASGPPDRVLTKELVERVYETRASVIVHPLTGAPQILLEPDGTDR